MLAKRYALCLVVFTIVLAIASQVASTGHSDDRDRDNDVAIAEYESVFGHQNESNTHYLLLRRFARDIQLGALDVCVMLLPGSEVDINTPTVITKDGEGIVEVNREEFIVQPDRWYLVGRVDTARNVGRFSIRVTSPPLSGAFVILRDTFPDEYSYTSTAVYELSADLEPETITILAFEPIGYASK